MDQIFTLRNIPGQCTEWQRQLYINVDFEKAFDGIHRESLWRNTQGVWDSTTHPPRHQELLQQLQV